MEKSGIIDCIVSISKSLSICYLSDENVCEIRVVFSGLSKNANKAFRITTYIFEEILSSGIQLVAHKSLLNLKKLFLCTFSSVTVFYHNSLFGISMSKTLICLILRI